MKDESRKFEPKERNWEGGIGTHLIATFYRMTGAWERNWMVCCQYLIKRLYTMSLLSSLSLLLLSMSLLNR